MRKDLLSLSFVKVEDVEETICRQILNKRIRSILDFYNIENKLMATCDETNTIIIDWNGQGRMATCNTFEDCVIKDKDFEGVCDKNHRCESCAQFMNPNEERTQCVCDTSQSIPCETKERAYWCCGGTTVCGVKANECIESDMTCSFYVGPITTTTGVYKSDCHFTVGSIENNLDEYVADCYFTIGGLGDKIQNGSFGYYNISVEGSGCGNPDEYCALFWQDRSDGNDNGHWNVENTQSFEVGKTGTIWGKCQKLDVYNSTIALGAIYHQYASVDAVTACPVDYYCYLNWADTSCSVLDANASETIYGTCILTDKKSGDCPYNKQQEK